jgi:hypothetical protein
MTTLPSLRRISFRTADLRWTVALGLLLFLQSDARAGEPTAREIIDRYVATQSVDSVLAYVSLRRFARGELVDDKRLLAMTRRDGGTRASLMRVQRPEDLEGVTALFVDPAEGPASIYQYLPAVGQSREIRGSAMRAPFLGSDFTLQDLQREVPADNAYSRLPDSTVDGVACHAVAAVPRSPEDSAYARRVLHIAIDTNRLMQIDFFAEMDDTEPAKVFNAFAYGSSDVKGETRRPQRAVMIDHEKNTTSVLRVIESRLGTDLDAGYFTPEGIASMESKDVHGLLLGLDFEIRFDAD